MEHTSPSSSVRVSNPQILCRMKRVSALSLVMVAALVPSSSSFTSPSCRRSGGASSYQRPLGPLHMVMSIPDTSVPSRLDEGEGDERSGGSRSSGTLRRSRAGAASSSATQAKKAADDPLGDNKDRDSARRRRRSRKKYKRKRDKTPTEKARDQLRKARQADYDQLRARSAASGTSGPPSLWSFDTLFPEPVFDEMSVYKDLYEVRERDEKKMTARAAAERGGDEPQDVLTRVAQKKMRTPMKTPSRMNINRRATSSSDLPYERPTAMDDVSNRAGRSKTGLSKANSTAAASQQQQRVTVDKALTRMVEDRVYGYRRSQSGEFQYDTSLMGDGAVRFRDGVRLGNPLKVNTDRLTYHARRELARGRVEEAQELYERAIEIDPRDGRGYLGLSRVAQRRRDFEYARKCLRAGISNSASGTTGEDGNVPDQGPNPFLLQALGCLEERMGHLAEAEALFVSATKSRPSHAAAWVSLAQLRTRKLRQGAGAGRVCFQNAERELVRAGLPPSSYVYTAWASMEYKKAGDIRRARELFKLALEVDPRCSAAWLQLGVMEADRENWSKAQECFEEVLTFDQRNSRVLQAYAIMESKRPDGDSREAIGLFERALKTNPRDGGVLQAYALYVAKLGDINAARDLLRRGTEVDKKHSAVWQAWGVLETRHGSAKEARDIFQQGIWACAQSGGGQSGGRRCARLWQAWGVLEAREGDFAAARRCFSRALDADKRNIAAVTAWTSMESDLGNINDARSIFERTLKQFPSSSDDKTSLWRAYEIMEEKAGYTNEAQQVFQRSMRESIAVRDDDDVPDVAKQVPPVSEPPQSTDEVSKRSKEVEVVRWRTKKDVLGGEVWMNDGSIEGKVPASMMKKRKRADPKKQ